MTPELTEKQTDDALRAELVQEKIRLENTRTMLMDTKVSVETLTKEIVVISGNIAKIENTLRMRGAGEIEPPPSPRLVGCEG